MSPLLYIFMPPIKSAMQSIGRFSCSISKTSQRVPGLTGKNMANECLSHI